MIYLPLVLLSAQYWVYLQIVDRLKTFHTNQWVALGMPSGAAPDTTEVTPEILAERSLSAFLMKGEFLKLEDDRLTRLVLAWRALGTIAIVVVMALLIGWLGQ